MNPVMMALMPWVRQGYCCGQLLTLLMLQAMERENPDLVCAAGGLCHGLGHSDGPCGLLTSGAMALALAAGTAQDGVSPHPMQTPVIHEYAAWFYERVASYGGLRCSQIARGLGASSGQQGEEPNPVACGELLAECWEKMLELVQNYELDLSRET